MAEITSENNFIRVFRLPELFPPDFYCFGGGKEVGFWLVDWFNPVPDAMIENFNTEKHREMIREFIKGKIYYDPNYKFLAITDYGEAFLI